MKLFLATLLLTSIACAGMPSRSELRAKTVRVVNKAKNSGGSGAIVSSGAGGSLILTNSHVCEVVEKGGYVTKEGNAYSVIAYKRSPDHDLCLVKVKQNLGIQTKVARFSPKINQTTIVSGHPRLLPNIITVGHLTDKIRINVMIGVEECTEEEMLTDYECHFFGVKPIIKPYNSQLVSNLIQPGNSGSSVFNKNGEIIAVIFAGGGDLSFGFVVPHMYVSYFMQTHSGYGWNTPSTSKKKKTASLETVKEKCAETTTYPNQEIKKICKIVEKDAVFRGE